MRRDRAGVAAVLLALCAWWGWHTPAAPQVAEVVHAPELEAHEACMQSDDPIAGPMSTASDDTASPVISVRMSCPMPDAVLAVRPSGTVRLDRRSGSAFEEASFTDHALRVTRYDDATSGTVYLDGFSPVQLSIAGGRCTVGAVVAQASISGVIVPTAGADEDQVVVQGCGANVRVDRHGGFFAQVDPGPCTLFAVRRDGALSVRSVPLQLDPAPGAELAVELVLPSWHAASAGAELRQDEDGGVVLGAVRPDSPAARAGLLPGDHLLTVDGAEVDGLPLWDVLDLTLGPEGSEVVYTVERRGREVEVGLTRETQD